MGNDRAASIRAGLGAGVPVSEDRGTEVIELRCPAGHLWGKALAGGVVEFKCRYCSKARGRPVFHLFSTATGECRTEVR